VCSHFIDIVRVMLLAIKRRSAALSVVLSVAALVLGVWLQLRASAPQVPPSAGASMVHAGAAGATRSGVDRLPSTLAPVVMQTLQAASDASYHAVAIPAAQRAAPSRAPQGR
jgi:hypothetical protein